MIPNANKNKIVNISDLSPNDWVMCWWANFFFCIAVYRRATNTPKKAKNPPNSQKRMVTLVSGQPSSSK